jgi:hypothetical protein
MRRASGDLRVLVPVALVDDWDDDLDACASESTLADEIKHDAPCFAASASTWSMPRIRFSFQTQLVPFQPTMWASAAGISLLTMETT